MKLVVLISATILIVAIKLTTAVSVAPIDTTEFITIEYCDIADCPGCPPWPDCDCGRIALSEQNAALVADTIVSEPVATPPVVQTPVVKNGGGGRKESTKRYKHRPTPRKPNRGKHHGHNGGHNRGQHCGTEKPIESIPCICPLILCAAPPQCEC